MKLSGRSARLTALGAALALAAGALLAAPATQAADYPPAIPVAPQGTGTLFINGAAVTVVIAPLPNGTGVSVSGPGIRATLQAVAINGRPEEIIIGANGDPILIVQSDGAATTAGSGFQAFSVVNLLLTPNVDGVVNAKGSTKATSIKFGSTTTSAQGDFKTTTPLPPGLAPGDYTITMAGTGPDGKPIYLNVGVRVAAAKVTKTTTKVFFAIGSPALDAGARADLDALIKRVPKGATGVKVKVTGYVQPTSFSGNDQTLSSARAKNVAAYLKDGGLKGAYIVSGAGKATQTGAAARRVEVVVTYTK